MMNKLIKIIYMFISCLTCTAKVTENKLQSRLSRRGVTHKYLMRNTIAQENDIDINSIFVPKQSRKQICVHFLSLGTNVQRIRHCNIFYKAVDRNGNHFSSIF